MPYSSAKVRKNNSRIEKKKKKRKKEEKRTLTVEKSFFETKFFIISVSTKSIAQIGA
jgi:hypothetical protein